MPNKAVLIVIDGLTPSMFENAVGDRSAPTLSEFAEAGEYRRGVTVETAAVEYQPAGPKKFKHLS